MQLPVHSQALAAASLGSGGYLLIYVLVRKSCGIVAVPGLGQLRVVVVCRLRVGVCSLVDNVANLVGNSPAEVLAVLVF
jgi:hypothetical protein